MNRPGQPQKTSISVAMQTFLSVTQQKCMCNPVHLTRETRSGVYQSAPAACGREGSYKTGWCQLSCLNKHSKKRSKWLILHPRWHTPVLLLLTLISRASHHQRILLIIYRHDFESVSWYSLLCFQGTPRVNHSKLVSQSFSQYVHQVKTWCKDCSQWMNHSAHTSCLWII